jgi:hypothetical protein
MKNDWEEAEEEGGEKCFYHLKSNETPENPGLAEESEVFVTCRLSRVFKPGSNRKERSRIWQNGQFCSILQI